MLIFAGSGAEEGPVDVAIHMKHVLEGSPFDPVAHADGCASMQVTSLTFVTGDPLWSKAFGPIPTPWEGEDMHHCLSSLLPDNAEKANVIQKQFNEYGKADNDGWTVSACVRARVTSMRACVSVASTLWWRACAPVPCVRASLR